MIRTITHTHELFTKDDVVEIQERIYQCDHDHITLSVAFTQNGEPVDLNPYVVSVTNKAPNNMVLMQVADVDAPVTVDGNVVSWKLEKFDTAQVGTYCSQIHVATDEMTLTVVFVKYNVERSNSGKLQVVPVRYTSLSELAEQVNLFQEQAEQLKTQIDELNGQYDLFKQIIEDSGFTWETLPEKPDSYPPSPHTHEQYELKTVVEALDDRVVENANDIAELDASKADRAHLLEAVLWAHEWQGDAAPYTQTIEVPGMKANGLYGIEYERSDVLSVQLAKERQWGYIGTFLQEEGRVTAKCSVIKPGVDYRLKFYYLGSEVEG